MSKKHVEKIPKFKSGDIVTYTDSASGKSCLVILETRQDNNKTNDISWWAFDYPSELKKYAIPERELSPTN